LIAGSVGATSATPNFGAVKVAALTVEPTPKKLIARTKPETTLTNFFILIKYLRF